MIVDWLVAALILAGAVLMTVATLGIVRFPDTITRLAAATKAGPVGVSFMLVAVAIELQGSAALQAVMVMAFLLLTAPVAAHTIARGAYFVGVELWEGTQRDDLRTSGDLERTFEMEERAIEEEERRERREDRAVERERERHVD